MKKDKTEVKGDFVQAQAPVKQKEVKKDKKKNKKPSIFKRMGEKAKDIFSELKKVSWPTFKQVVKKTGVVLAVVVFFGLVLFGFDYVLKFMFKLITSSAYTQTELWATVGILGAIVIAVVVCVSVWISRKKRKGNK